MSRKPTKSPAKLQLIEFIRHSKPEMPYRFRVLGNTAIADKFVHQMRVELSRMRETLRARNIVPKAFKLMLDEIQYDPVKDECTITIRQTNTASSAVHSDIDEILDTIAGGKKVDNLG